MIVYDNRFNVNEWFVIIGLCIGLLLVFLLPKRFPQKVSITFFMCGVYSGFLFDHSLSVEPVSFYDVNDSSRFQIIDFVSYWMYGPASYLFFYVWDYIGNKKFRVIPIYVFIWACVAVGLEWLAVSCGVFHYQHGYKLAYSFPIYVLTITVWVLLYYSFRVLDARGENI